MDFLTTNRLTNFKKETLNGVEYLVCPLRAMKVGVMNGSRGPLFYPGSELQDSVDAWNHMPIVVNHPMKNNRFISARTPDVLNSVGVGFAFNSRKSGEALDLQAWINLDRLKTVNKGLADKLERGEPIEVSTGLETDNQADRGVYNGQSYTHVARNYRPDHIALLPGERGACSVDDGCGLLVNTFDFVSNCFDFVTNSKWGKGWWINTKNNKVIKIDSGDLGPHGDHDGWISLGDNAAKLGVDVKKSKAFQAAQYGILVSDNPEFKPWAEEGDDYLELYTQEGADIKAQFNKTFGMSIDQALTYRPEGLWRARQWKNGSVTFSNEFEKLTSSNFKKLNDLTYKDEELLNAVSKASQFAIVSSDHGKDIRVSGKDFLKTEKLQDVRGSSSQSKPSNPSTSKSSAEGVWKTTSDGNKIYIKGDTAHVGGPNGPVLNSFVTNCEGKPGCSCNCKKSEEEEEEEDPDFQPTTNNQFDFISNHGGIR